MLEPTNDETDYSTTTSSTILCPIISWHSHFPGLLKR